MSHKFRCLVKDCQSESKPRSKFEDKISFFKLPKDASGRNLWLQRLGRPDLINKKLPDAVKVCSKHFSEEMFCKSGHRITPYAVPKKVEIPITAEDEDFKLFWNFVLKVSPEKENGELETLKIVSDEPLNIFTEEDFSKLFENQNSDVQLGNESNSSICLEKSKKKVFIYLTPWNSESQTNNKE